MFFFAPEKFCAEEKIIMTDVSREGLFRHALRIQPDVVIIYCVQ